VRERKAPTTVRVVELSACPFPPACARPRIRGSPRLNLAEARDFPEKTCIAFYCWIDHLNNSQHGNPSPMRSVCSVLAFSSRPLFLTFLPFPLCITLLAPYNYTSGLILLFLPRIHDLCIYAYLQKKIDYNVSD